MEKHSGKQCFSNNVSLFAEACSDAFRPSGKGRDEGRVWGKRAFFYHCFILISAVYVKVMTMKLGWCVVLARSIRLNC